MMRGRGGLLSVVVAIVLLVLGVWFYYAYFLTTESALQQAERLSLRRMTVARLGEQGAYRFFFVTNRQPAVDEVPVERRFGPERRDQLAYGSFDAVIEPTLGIGMIIDPSAWFLNEEITLRDVRTLDRAGFVEQLRLLVQRSPHHALLVVVHGFREAFPSALRKTAFLGHVLDINAPLLLFDWPGNQGSSLAGYRRARTVAKESGAELAAALELIVNEIRPDRLWLIANSMGGQVVADALGLLYRRSDWADVQTEFEDVILTAPDIDHDAFDRHIKHEIDALAGQLTVYVSSNDRALLMSRIINRGRRRGESTLDIRNPEQLDEALSVLQLIDPDSEGITLVDVTPVNRTRNFHNFSLETPEFFDDLFLRLTNRDTPLSRLRYPVQTPDGSVYWVLTPGR